MAGTNYFTPITSAIDVALTDEHGNATLAKCPTASIPSATAGYAIGCILIDTTTGQLHYNTGTASSCTFNKYIGQYYVNQTGSTETILKIHNHLTTAGIGSYEGKADTVSTSGAFYGAWQDANINATGTTSATAILGVATVAATFTVTGGTLIGTYGQVRADGNVAGNAFMAGLYGLVEEGGGSITASHVASVWADSHRNTAVTGNHELFYGSNNGTATMDQAFYIYGGNKISNLFELNTVTGMTSASNGSGADVYINCTIDGVAIRLTGKYVA